MATVQIKDDKSFVKAIELLLEMGGIFRTKFPRQLIVGPGQLQGLRAAGFVPNAKGARRRGKKSGDDSGRRE